MKRYEDGQLVGELRIVGLFTSEAYTQSVLDIPMLRRKANNALRTWDFDPDSHSGNALRHILETYPRDELFQIDEDLLARFSLAILQLSERPRVRVLPRIDPFDRFVSLLVYVPRDRFTTQVREPIEAMMTEAYDGHVSARYLTMPEGVLNRLHLIIGRREGETPAARPARPGRPHRGASSAHGPTISCAPPRPRPKLGLDRFKIGAWSDSFSDSYRATYTAERAVRDITILERITDETPTAILFFRRDPEGRTAARSRSTTRTRRSSCRRACRSWRTWASSSSTSAPSGSSVPDSEDGVYIHDMTLAVASGAEIDVAGNAEKLQALFIAVWEGAAESDDYNALLLNAGLGWRDIAVLRAMSRYLRQTAIPYGQELMAQTLNRYPDLGARADRALPRPLRPAHDEAEREGRRRQISESIGELCNDIESLADDTIVHRFQNVIEATLRTNVFQHEDDGAPARTFAFKLDPHKLIGLPRPAPYREIWVYSPRVEGVHLRFGAVAARRAAMVRPAAGLPHRGAGPCEGAAGEERRDRARRRQGRLLPQEARPTAPSATHSSRRGATPTRSSSTRCSTSPTTSTATTIVAARARWCATTATIPTSSSPPTRARPPSPTPPTPSARSTASGSTMPSPPAARRATTTRRWASPPAAPGRRSSATSARWTTTSSPSRSPWWACGDMSGDVFGNGMLLSKTTQADRRVRPPRHLHRPQSGPGDELDRAQALFDMPRSSWQDYDRATLLSQGGGIYLAHGEVHRPVAGGPRGARHRPPGAPTPQDVMRAILKAPADLLWFGGIGTYVRAGSEVQPRYRRPRQRSRSA